MPNGVLVLGEATEDGKLAPITRELIGAASRLASPVVCALLGAGVQDLAKECLASGASKVIVVDDAILSPYQGDAYAPVLEGLVRQEDPAVLLLGQTLIGRDLAPRVAQRLGSAVIMDVVALEMANGKLVVEKPVFGGSAHARYTINGTPQIATVRGKSQEPLEADPSRQGEIVKQAAGVDASAVRTKIVAQRKEKAEGVRLEDATVVVSGGRGLGGPEGFEPLEELAKILSGAVGASRAAVDAGWCPVGYQVGLTGKIVTPDLYIAVAISGASQHMAGLSGAKNIVSINKDAEANIFKQSRFAVVGDWKNVLPAFTEKVKEIKAAS